MPQYVQIANIILSSLTVLAQALSLVLLYALLTKKQRVLNLVPPVALRSAFIIALIAMFGSLFYSEIAGYEPCTLCWYQRILMYPQVILLGSALLFKWKDILKACGVLSGLGACVAGYHYLLQLGVVKGTCGVVGYSVSCSQRFVMNFGYITIPLMAFSAFLLILLLVLTAHRFQRSHERSLEKNNP